jgi:hypothetical protein
MAQINEFEVSPYAFGTPEDRAYNEHQGRLNAVALGQVLPAWASQLLPISSGEDGKGYLAAPGAATGGYHFLGKTIPEFVNWASRKAGVPLNIGTAPGAERAGELAEGSRRWAEANVPRVEPQNENEAHIADVGHNAFSMAIPAPGLATLPKVVTRLMHVAAPGIGGGVKGAVLGAAIPEAANAAIDYVHDAENEKLAREMNVDPKTGLPLPKPGTTAQPAPPPSVPGQRVSAANVAQPATAYASPFDAPMDLTQPDTSSTVAHPGTGAPVNVPFPTGSTEPPPLKPGEKYADLSRFGRPDIKITTPDFGAATGETETPWWKAMAYGAAGVAATSLALRYGGKYFDPLAKVVLGKGDEISNTARSIEHNQRIAQVERNGIGAVVPEQTGAVRGEAPLPGKAGYETTRVAQNLYDKNRVLTETARAVSPNSGVAKQWEARIGTVNNTTPLMNRITEQMYTGVNLANGGKVLPKLGEIAEDWGRLSPERINRLERGLTSADELDTRNIKWRQATKAPGKTLDDEAMRHNYTTTHSDQLRAAEAEMLSDPVTASMANRIYELQRENIIHARDQGRISTPDMYKILKDRPRQIPSTNTEGEIERALGRREINAKGWETPPTKAIEAVIQHYGKLYPELERNSLTHDLMTSVKGWQDANPNRARIVTLRKNAQGKLEAPSEGPAVGRRITTYKDGVAHVWEVDNSTLYRALKNNTAQVNMAANVADITRRMFQSGMTGPLATLGGRAFAPISLHRNIMQLATDRAPGTTFGMLDRSLQKLTGGKVGSRLGVDPTQWIGSYNEALKGSGAVTARAMSRAMLNPENYASKGLRALVGNTWVDAWGKTLEQRWATSNAAMRRAEGASGTGLGGTYDRPTYNIDKGRRLGYSGIADAAYNVYNPKDIHLPYTHIRIPGARGTLGSYINVRNWMRDIHREVSEGANSYYWKEMKNNPNITREQRVYNTRQVLGDPSVQGAGKFAESMARNVPWANASIQDAVRMMRNLRDNPVAFTLGTVQTLGLGAAASILSAMLGGKRHINMLSHLMTTHDRASNITFFHDPSNEHNYTQISLPQRWRFMNPILLEGAANGLGVFSMHPDDPKWDNTIRALAELFSHHVSHSTVKGTIEGAADFLDIAQAPPLLQTGAAITGHQIQPPLGTVMGNVYEGKSPLSNMISSTDKTRRVPGQSSGGTFTEGDDAKWVHGVLHNVFGTAAEGMLHAWNAGKEVYNGHDLADATSGLLSNVGQSWRDNSQYGNVVWGNNIKLAQRNPMAEVNEQAYNKISHMPPATDSQLTGLTRRGGVPVSIQGTQNINSDPQIIGMVRVINNYHTQISKTTEPQISDLKRQIADVNQDTAWAPQTKRKLLNELVASKNELESKKNQQIEMLNAELSVLAGGRRVNILTFDPRKGMDQFR